MDKSKSKKKKTISLPAAATLKEAQSNVDKLAQETVKISSSSKDLGDTMVEEQIYQLESSPPPFKEQTKMPSVPSRKGGSYEVQKTRQNFSLPAIQQPAATIELTSEEKENLKYRSMTRFDKKKMESHSETLLKNDFAEFKTVILI
jgi:hypothetical protein